MDFQNCDYSSVLMFWGDLDALILVIIISTKKTCLVVKSAQNNAFGSGTHILQSFSVASLFTVRTLSLSGHESIYLMRTVPKRKSLNSPHQHTLRRNLSDSTSFQFLWFYFKLHISTNSLLVYFNLDFWIFAFNRENKWNLYDFRSSTYWGIKTDWQWQWQELATSSSSLVMWPCWEAIRFLSLCLPPCLQIASYMFLLHPVDGW